MSRFDGPMLRGPARLGDWIQVHSGGQFWPLDPRVDEVRIDDIAHALSMVCRFTGHIKEFYSVAQHSVLVARTVQRWLNTAICDGCKDRDPTKEEKAVLCRDVDDKFELLCDVCYLHGDRPEHSLLHPLTPFGVRQVALAGLLHDGSEAYICDIARPIKMLPEMAPYRAAERAVQACVYHAFGLLTEPQIVKRADNVLLATEARDLLANMHPDWSIKPPRWPTVLERVKPWTPPEAERIFLETFAELRA